MSLDHLNAGVVGAVEPDTFVHRLYQDSHVRFRLMGKFEGDNHVANVVEFRMITGNGVADIAFKHEVFGITMLDWAYAQAVFKAWVKNYIERLELPK